MVGVLSGHCRLPRHLHLLSIEGIPIYQNYLATEEIVYHFLGRSDRWGVAREKKKDLLDSLQMNSNVSAGSGSVPLLRTMVHSGVE